MARVGSARMVREAIRTILMSVCAIGLPGQQAEPRAAPQPAALWPAVQNGKFGYVDDQGQF